jgi:exodeoxyribonuclease VII large subunit
LLETLSYRKTLARGFSLVHGPGGQVLSYIDQAKKFAELTVEFQDGFLKVKNEEALS